MAAYEPRPLETSGIQLPSALEELQERLARNTHEVWAHERLSQGWTLGPRRDDERKQHPCLIPYEQLPESEKAYDRKVTRATLAAIVALGYHIEPPPTPADRAATPLEVALGPLESAATLEELDVSGVLALWQGRVPEHWQPTTYQALAHRLLALGEPLLAYDITSEGLSRWSSDARLRQLQALALARSGATGRANALLRELYAGGARDEETLGMLARTEKDFALDAAEPATRARHLQQAAELYSEAFERHGGYWSGINAATLYVLLDQTQRARALAERVRAQCLADPVGYWALATLGEAALVLDEPHEAVRWYTQAAALGRHRLGDLASTRRNARLLLEHRPDGAEAIQRALRMPSVALFRALQAEAYDATFAEQVRAQLDAADCLVGYAPLASLADVVFFEVLLERGATATAVVPYEAEQYLKDVAEPAWYPRAAEILRRVSRVVVASPHGAALGASVYDQFADQLLDGLALAHARRLETTCVRLGSQTGPSAPVAASTDGSQIVAMLFADAVHFSRLNEEEVIRFTEHFMGRIGRLIADSPYAPVFTNTWGDGLFFVFSSVRDAGMFALALCDLANGTNWVAHGLPAELNLRIGLHAGPVQRCADPVTGRTGYLGTHISRAARIEPITPPGHVYASEPFAALAELDRVVAFSLTPAPGYHFACDYVGQTPQAKGYGTFPTYHVRPT